MTTQEHQAMSLWVQNLGIARPKEAQHLCRHVQDRVARLYLFAGKLGISITVVSGQSSQLMIQELDNDETIAPAWLRERLGTFAIPHLEASRFLDDLSALGGWSKGDCITNTRDGVVFLHVLATIDAEHCFKMDNPEYQKDRTYREIANLYANRFLGGHLRRP